MKLSFQDRNIYIGLNALIEMQAKENKTLFLEQLGDTPQLRVLDFLIENYMFDYPMTEIARGANVSYNSLKLFFDKFLKSAVLIKTRKVGKSNYYQLNIKNPFIRRLMQLDWLLIENDILKANKSSVQIHR